MNMKKFKSFKKIQGHPSGGYNHVVSPSKLDGWLVDDVGEKYKHIFYNTVCMGFFQDSLYDIFALLNYPGDDANFELKENQVAYGARWTRNKETVAAYNIKQYNKFIIEMAWEERAGPKETWEIGTELFIKQLKEYHDNQGLFFESWLEKDGKSWYCAFDLNDLKDTVFHLTHWFNAYRIIHMEKPFCPTASLSEYIKIHEEFIKYKKKHMKGIEHLFYTENQRSVHGTGPVAFLTNKTDKADIYKIINKNKENDVEEQKKEELAQQALQELQRKLDKSKMYVKIKSRHPTHNALRKKIKTLVPVIFRLGSTTQVDYAHYMINSPEAVGIASDKRKMKQVFGEAGVTQAEYVIPKNTAELNEFLTRFNKTKFIVKSPFSSKGEGLYLFDNKEDVTNFFNQKSNAGSKCYNYYVVEKFYNYSKEYRLHVTLDGCFYTCRKMIKADTPENNRWHRHNTNSVWILQENPAFERPSNWKQIEEQSVNALKASGLTVGAVDVICSKDGEKGCKFIICEINSAPSFGELTAIKYEEIITKIVNQINLKTN